MVFLQQDFFALNQTSFSKDSFTNDAVKKSAFASLKEFKLTSFESSLRKKEISSKPRVASQGMLQDTGMAPGSVLQNPAQKRFLVTA